MANKNYQIAKLYSALFDLQTALNSDILPMAVHIGLPMEDPELFEAMQNLTDKAERHLEIYELSLSRKSEEM